MLSKVTLHTNTIVTYWKMEITAETQAALAVVCSHHLVAFARSQMHVLTADS